MRIASWNVGYWQRGARSGYWNSIVRTLREARVDVVLLQETSPVFELEGVFEELSKRPNGLSYGWGTAVMSLNPNIGIRRIPWVPADGHVPAGSFGCSHPGTVAVAELQVAEQVLTVASVYGRMFDGGNQRSYASTTMHRIISDLVPFLDRHGRIPEVIVGGDFNCTTQWERPRDRLMDSSVFQRLQDHGTVDLLRDRFPDRRVLEDCFCPEAGGCQHVRTLRHGDQKDSRPFQDDYIFASDALAARAAAFVLDTEDVWAISDHCIVGVDLDLGSPR